MCQLLSARRRDSWQTLNSVLSGASLVYAQGASGVSLEFVAFIRCHTCASCHIFKFVRQRYRVIERRSWVQLGFRATFTPQRCCIALKCMPAHLVSPSHHLAVSDTVTCVVSQGVQRSQPVRIHGRSATITTLACIFL